MSKLINTTAVLTLLGAGVATALTKPADRADGGIVLDLEQIKEVRRQNFTEDGDSGFSMFDTPGLELRFAIDAPPGRHIVDLKQPATLDAVDSLGTDLTSLPPGNFGRPKHVDTVREWDKPPHAMTFKLALPDRAAKHFTLVARVDALTYSKLKEGTVFPESDWTPVTNGIFGEKQVRVRVQRKRGNVHVIFSPGTVRDMIETVELYQAGETLESEGVMWNDLEASYMFTATTDFDESKRLAAKIKVRQGLKSMPIDIELKEQPLP